MDMRIDSSIEPIKPLKTSFDGLTAVSHKKDNSDDTFEKVFRSALNMINETNEYQYAAEKMQVDYVTGETDDIIGLNLAQAKASSALSFTTQVTNKILTAYQEIMRMSL